MRWPLRVALARAGLRRGRRRRAGRAESRPQLGTASNPLAPRPPHFPAKARSVIFLFMDGGPSQVDTFDPKPRLDREHGQPIKVKTHPTQFNNVGNVLGCPWKFRHYGESGIPVSDLFPHVGQCVDDLAIVRSMVSNFSEHTSANYFMHTGSGLQGRPSHGAWVTYGLGSECQDLPGFVVLNGGLIPPGGIDCFNSGFLPASFQGSVFKPAAAPVANITPTEPTPELQRRKLDLLRTLDQGVLGRMGRHDGLEAAIANYELAFRMQAAVPELMSLDGESAATRRLYGLDDPYPPTQIFARECLIARRLVERGVRFIELLCPNVGGDRWDQHADLKNGHENNARAVDQPIAGLLTDLKARGLLEIDAGRLGRRVRPHARWPRDPTAATTTPTASPSGWPAAGSRAARSTAPPTTTATTPSKTRSRSTTCTPRCFTSWASTTSD